MRPERAAMSRAGCGTFYPTMRKVSLVREYPEIAPMDGG